MFTQRIVALSKGKLLLATYFYTSERLQLVDFKEGRARLLSETGLPENHSQKGKRKRMLLVFPSNKI